MFSFFNLLSQVGKFHSQDLSLFQRNNSLSNVKIILYIYIRTPKISSILLNHSWTWKGEFVSENEILNTRLKLLSSPFPFQHQWLRVPDVPQKGQPHNRDATVGMEPATRRRVQLEYVQLPLDAVHDVH